MARAWPGVGCLPHAPSSLLPVNDSPALSLVDNLSPPPCTRQAVFLPQKGRPAGPRGSAGPSQGGAGRRGDAAAVGRTGGKSVMGAGHGLHGTDAAAEAGRGAGGAKRISLFPLLVPSRRRPVPHPLTISSPQPCSGARGLRPAQAPADSCCCVGSRYTVGAGTAQ